MKIFWHTNNLETQNEIIKSNNQNRKDTPLFILICLECYTIWQFGITYFADNSFSLYGNSLMPFAKNLDTIFLIGGLASCITVAVFYNYIVKISRVTIIISFLVSFLRLFNALQEYFTIFFYIESFCSMFFFGFIFAIAIQGISKKSVLLQAIISTVFSGIVISLLNLLKPILSLRFYTITSCILQFSLFYGLLKFPIDFKTKVFCKKNLKEFNTKKRNFSQLMFLFLIFLISSETFIMQSALTLVETVTNGIALTYSSAIGGSILFIYLYFYKKRHIYSIFTTYSTICSIGFVFFLLSNYLSIFSVISCLIIGFSFIMFSLVVFFALILFSFYAVKSIFLIFPVTISLTAFLHSLILNSLKTNTRLLITVYCCFTIILLIFWIKHEHLIISSYNKLKDENSVSSLTQNTSLKTNKLLTDKLSIREKEVVDLLLQGMSNPQIAEKLYISVNTVDTHRKEIYKKLNIHSRSELFKIAKE